MKHKRRWGFYEILEETEFYKIKRLTLNSGASISLQTHEHRNEQWVLISGAAQARVGAQLRHLTQPGASVSIPKGTLHHLVNLGMQQLVIIEIQTGTYFGEDDIERYENIVEWQHKAHNQLQH